MSHGSISAAARSVALSSLILLGGCGGGGDSAAPTYAVGGTISGLAGTGLVLQLNGAGDLALAAAGPFKFAHDLTTGSNYAVTIKTQPGNPTQACAVSNGTGTVSAADVSSVAIACQTLRKVGGTLKGLSLSHFSSGVVLQDNGADDLTLSSDGAFSFATLLSEGSAYAVTLKGQPTLPSENCTVTHTTGTIAGADITDIAVDCSRTPAQVAVVANTIGTVDAYAVQGPLPFHISDTANTAGGLHTVVIDPSGQFVYIGSDLRQINAFRLDPATGTLTPLSGSPYDDSSVPSAVLVDPTARFLYVANLYGGATSQGSISAFSIDPQSGGLTELSGSPYTVNYNPSALAIDPLGKTLYVPTYAGVPGQIQVTAFAINQQSGALTPIALSPFATSGGLPKSIVAHPSDAYLYVRSDAFTSAAPLPSIATFSIDQTTGALSALPGSPVTGDSPFGMAISPSGAYLYATSDVTASSPGIWAYAVDPQNGSLSAVSGSPFQDTPSLTAIAVDPTSGQLFVTSQTGGGDPSSGLGALYVYDIAPATGVISNRQGPYAAGDFPYALALY